MDRHHTVPSHNVDHSVVGDWKQQGEGYGTTVASCHFDPGSLLLGYFDITNCVAYCRSDWAWVKMTASIADFA